MTVCVYRLIDRNYDLKTWLLVDMPRKIGLFVRLKDDEEIYDSPGELLIALEKSYNREIDYAENQINEAKKTLLILESEQAFKEIYLDYLIGKENSNKKDNNTVNKLVDSIRQVIDLQKVNASNEDSFATNVLKFASQQLSSTIEFEKDDLRFSSKEKPLTPDEHKVKITKKAVEMLALYSDKIPILINKRDKDIAIYREYVDFINRMLPEGE